MPANAGTVPATDAMPKSPATLKGVMPSVRPTHVAKGSDHKASEGTPPSRGMPESGGHGSTMPTFGDASAHPVKARDMPGFAVAQGGSPAMEMPRHATTNTQKAPHVFVMPGQSVPPRSADAVGFDYPTTLQGSTTHFTVYYQTGFANGPTLAAAVLASCESDYNSLQGFFGNINVPNLPFNIIIASGVGGAYHYGCTAVDLYCDGQTSANPSADHTRMLLVAEADEVFMAATGRGWNCGASNGEGLSRVLATELYPQELNGFTSAASWLDGGRPDWVNQTEQTDRDYVSIGCAVLFLNYLRYQLGFSWTQIINAGASTLAQVYANLTGQADGFTPFKNLLQAHYPEGQPSGLTSDNPFPLSMPVDWASLGGVITSSIAVARNADGRLEIFARGTDNALWHNWQVQPSGAWSGWNSLDGSITSDPSVSRNADGRLEVFARGTDNALWHNWQVQPSGAWSGWNSLGGSITSDVAVGQNADGRFEAFGRGTDNALWHNWQVQPGGAWSGWNSLDGSITSDPSVSRNADGRLEVFARGTDNALWHNWQVQPNGAWSGWNSLGGVITTDPTLGQNADGRLEVFARGTDNALWHNWQVQPGGAWSGWNSLDGVIMSTAAIGCNLDGRLEAFARGTDNSLWHNWQVAPSGGWSGWNSLGGSLTSTPAFPLDSDAVTVYENADGRLEAFVRGTDGGVYHCWQVSPGGGWG